MNMFGLGQFDPTEVYNNSGALLGLDGDNEELIGDLLGALKRMNPIQRMRTMSRITSSGPPSRGSRGEMEKFFSELPNHIREGLRKGELRLADTIIYSIKNVASKTVKIFETQDVREIGLRNISNAKLAKNQALLVSGIILLAGVSTGQTPDELMSANYTGIEAIPQISTGEFDLKANKKQIVPETGNNVFKTSGFSMTPTGYYKLANPRLIHDDVLIELTISLGTMTGVAANTNVWAGLHGTVTTP